MIKNPILKATSFVPNVDNLERFARDNDFESDKWHTVIFHFKKLPKEADGRSPGQAIASIHIWDEILTIGDIYEPKK